MSGEKKEEVKRKQLVIVYILSEEPHGSTYILPVDEFTTKIRRHLDMELRAKPSNKDELDFDEWCKIVEMWRSKGYKLETDNFVPSPDEVVVEYFIGRDWN